MGWCLATHRVLFLTASAILPCLGQRRGHEQAYTPPGSTPLFGLGPAGPMRGKASPRAVAVLPTVPTDRHGSAEYTA